MSWLHGLRHRVRTLLFPRSYARELDEEMRLHLELDALQLQDLERARRHFGNRTYYAEETRLMTWLGTLDIVRQDLGYAWRSVRRAPGFTALAIITLALGIGVNAATFAVLDELYLRPPGGVDDPASVRRIWVQHFNTGDGVPFTAQSLHMPMYRVIARAADDSARVAVFTTDYSLRLGPTRAAPRVRGVYASANYFDVLGVRAAMGRFYSAEEDRFGDAAPVAVVSADFWRTQLGGDSAAVGRPIAIGRNDYTVIGVLDHAFTGLDLRPADVWIPLSTWPGGGSWWESPNAYRFRAIQRLASGAVARDFEHRATLSVRALNREMFAQRPDTQMTVSTGSINEARGPGSAGQELVIATRLGGVAIIVLIIALANVTNLLLSRAVRRRREIAVRLALGISRWRLVRLLTMETVLLASIAAFAAAVAGGWGGMLLRSLLMPNLDSAGFAPHWRVMLFTAAVALFAGLVAGIVPALQASNPRLTTALKAGAREGVHHRSRLRRGLVVAQAALSVVLLVGAALFVRSLQNVQNLDIGFDADRLLFGEVAFDEGMALPPATIGATMRGIASRLETHPGVEAVARASMQPMRGISFVTWFSGADSSGSVVQPAPTMQAVSRRFFETAGITILRGTGFTGADADGVHAEVIVNDAMARQLWTEREVLGQCVRFVSRERPCYTVVGVVENVRRDRVIEEAPQPQYYLPLGNLPTGSWSGSTIIVRASPEAAEAVSIELRSALAAAFPAGYPSVTPMTENLAPEYRPWRLGATLFTAFGSLALVVAVVGIYSTVSYGVSQRTHEFGVRIALGARVRDVLRLVLGEGVRTVAIGILVGIVLALAAARLISALLYGVQPSDPAVLLVVAATLLLFAVLAALLPAWRAARVDPVKALREE